MRRRKSDALQWMSQQHQTVLGEVGSKPRAEQEVGRSRWHKRRNLTQHRRRVGPRLQQHHRVAECPTIGEKSAGPAFRRPPRPPHGPCHRGGPRRLHVHRHPDQGVGVWRIDLPAVSEMRIGSGHDRVAHSSIVPWLGRVTLRRRLDHGRSLAKSTSHNRRVSRAGVIRLGLAPFWAECSGSRVGQPRPTCWARTSGSLTSKSSRNAGPHPRSPPREAHCLGRRATAGVPPCPARSRRSTVPILCPRFSLWSSPAIRGNHVSAGQRAFATNDH